MQNARQAKPQLLVTIGPPGTGKSFFARRFSEMFGAPLVSFDEIRFELFNDISYTEDENVIVSRVAGLQLRELLKTHKTIVIDGGHNPKVSRIELGKVAKNAGYSILYVWAQIDQKTARERSQHRSSRHDDDQYNRVLSDEEFEAHAKKFTAPTQYENFVVISGRHNFPSQARTVLKKMVTPREDKDYPKEQPKPQGRDRRPISI